MIIRLMNANFSANNIGELNKFTIRVHGSGLASSEFTSPVDKGATATIKVTLNSGFTTDDISVKMSGDPITPTISSTGTNEYTITIPNVTGYIVVQVGEVESGGGSGEEPETGERKVDMTSITVDSNDTEHNLAGGTAGVSTGIVDSTNPYFNSNVYLPAGIYLTLPEGAYQVERYYVDTSGLAPSNMKMSFFNADKLVVTADDHSGIPDTTSANSTTEDGYPSTVISVPDGAVYFSYQHSRTASILAKHRILVHCK